MRKSAFVLAAAQVAHHGGRRSLGRVSERLALRIANALTLRANMFSFFEGEDGAKQRGALQLKSLRAPIKVTARCARATPPN